MKLVIFSDTHCTHDELIVPDGDMLIFAGDMCSYGQSNEVEPFVKWMKAFKHKHKISICGNHDFSFYRDRGFGKRLFKDTGIHYLQDSYVCIEGFKIYGSPWQPEFNNWAFNLPRGERLKEKWDKIPEDTDILITHCPPDGVLDCCPLPSGCADLRDRVLEIKPNLHIFGHIHTQNGIRFRDNITYVNASVVDDYNSKINEAIVLEIQ